MDVKAWLMLAQLLMMAVIGLYSWITSRQAASDKDLSEFKSTATAVESDLRERLATLEAELRAVPTAQVVHELSAALRGLEASLQGFGGRVDAMQRTVERVNDYLLNNGQK